MTIEAQHEARERAARFGEFMERREAECWQRLMEAVMRIHLEDVRLFCEAERERKRAN